MNEGMMLCKKVERTGQQALPCFALFLLRILPLLVGVVLDEELEWRWEGVCA